MAIDREEPPGICWHELQDVGALRDLLGIYRRQTAILAADVAAQRAESERLRDALRRCHAAQAIRLIEVEIDLDEHAQDLVGAILLTQLTDLAGRTHEDAVLVAREMAAGSARRNPESARAVLRIERSPTSLRVELQELTSPADPSPLGIVQRLNERWVSPSGSLPGPATAWAHLALADTP